MTNPLEEIFKPEEIRTLSEEEQREYRLSMDKAQDISQKNYDLMCVRTIIAVRQMPPLIIQYN